MARFQISRILDFGPIRLGLSEINPVCRDPTHVPTYEVPLSYRGDRWSDFNVPIKFIACYIYSQYFDLKKMEIRIFIQKKELETSKC